MHDIKYYTHYTHRKCAHRELERREQGVDKVLEAHHLRRRVCVCVRACVRACVRVCVCVCVLRTPVHARVANLTAIALTCCYLRWSTRPLSAVVNAAVICGGQSGCYLHRSDHRR